jgi:hypothetical protein
MRVPESVKDLERDLRSTFGDRLLSLVVYRPAIDNGRGLTPTLAIVDPLTTADLDACSARVAAWQDAGLATPLFLTFEEFGRSLDVFPLEFGAIIAEHAVVAGPNPFEGLHVDRAHLRHACEVQARSHLLHLREAYVETGGRGDAVADLIARSAESLAALIKSVARLQGMDAPDLAATAGAVEHRLGLPGRPLSLVVALGEGRSLTVEEARRLFPEYLDATERLTRSVDRWSAA